MKLLSLSGGGYRGLITLFALQKLERHHGPLQNHYDIIAGTSAGGIIACALASGMEVQAIIDLWQQLGTQVFRRNPLRGYLNAKYRIEDLTKVIKTHLGGKFNESRAKVLVTAFDTVNEEARILKTHENWENFDLADMAIATAAAPTYFAPYRVKGFTLLDGGVYSTNPSRECFTEALMLGAKPDDIQHLSLGTGFTKRNINVRDWGLAQWVLKGNNPIIRVFMESGKSVTAKTSSYIGLYRHVDVQIAEEHAPMDRPEHAVHYIQYGRKMAAML